MCPPTYFDIRYEINPWMSVQRPADRQEAQRQWDVLRDTLQDDLHMQVDTQPPVDCCPDMVFTANAGFVIGGNAVLSRFRHIQRQGEESYNRAWFQAAGLNVLELPPDIRFEGEGDALLLDGHVLMGYGQRSDAAAAQALQDAIGLDVIPVELVDPWFYHLDTCLAPISASRAIWYPDAFSNQAQRRIHGLFTELIPVPEQEARRLVCNAVSSGEDVVISASCPVTARQLDNHGYRVHQLDLDQFLLAGGGAKCLTLFLERPTALARATPSFEPRRQVA
jgi:N-dimethylarginine dimethylaminohydrolase